MENSHPGSFRLFRFAGISVFLHWTWFLVAYILYRLQSQDTEPMLFIAVYVSLFAIVLMHEFGHALACRMVGGTSDTIVLWPLGGIAFVKPPPRPGAMLWSIIAGPLVNVVLVPVLFILLMWVGVPEDMDLSAGTTLQRYALSMFSINLGLLIFNMLPIYPLDGGQVLQSLLWFVIGFRRSLHIVAAIGLLCGLLGFAAALMTGDYWLMILAGFVAWRSWIGGQIARHLAARERDQQANDAPPA